MADMRLPGRSVSFIRSGGQGIEHQPRVKARMAKIAFLMMVHKDPDRVVHHALSLVHHGDVVAIHVDKRAGEDIYRRIAEGVAGNSSIALARRTKCGWGEWSLVQATLNLIDTARAAFSDVTHYYLISGDCLPSKPRPYFDLYLDDDTDIVESHDFFDTNWIRVGIKQERLTYRHWFNERKHKRLFYASLRLQRRLGLSRRTPRDLKIRIGSQWWCLRAGTIEKIVALLRQRRDIVRFFRTTWIPDETFFQTLVAHVVPDEEIRCHPSTALLFSDYGMPVVFHNDHHDFVVSQPQPFARKVSARATLLQDQLWESFKSGDVTGQEGQGQSGLYSYLAGRGRVGQRYAPRFWEQAIGRRPEAEIMVITAKLWHVGTAFEKAIGTVTELPCLGYMFDDDGEMPLMLGNLERGLHKRDQHRHALMNLAFQVTGSDRLVLITDPSRHNLIEDLSGMVDHLRILLVDRPLTDQHLDDHVQRMGLIGFHSGEFERTEAIRAVRREFEEDTEKLVERYRGRLFINRLDRARYDNVTDIGHFLKIGRGEAEAIAREAEKLLQ